MLKSKAVFLILILASSSCQLFQTKTTDLASASSADAKKLSVVADEPVIPAKRKIAGENEIKCDLESDRCNGKPLSESQIAKTYALSDLVANQLLEIEKSENAAGRDFKIALLGRMGSNLKKFQPIKDKDANGKTIPLDQLVKNIIQASDEALSPDMDVRTQGGRVNPQVMSREFYDRTRFLKYSHLGIAVKNLEIKDKNGKIQTHPEQGYWGVIHLLYSCEDQKRAYVFKGTLKSFFYDHMNDYGSQIMVPDSALQANMEDILVKDYYGKFWIEKQYNAIALSNDLNQQNSNQWVLEVIAAALYPSGQIKDRAQAQEILRQTNYSETKVTPTGLYSALQVPLISNLASKFMPTVCMRYQPSIQKYGIGQIISALSLEEYLANMNRLSSKHEVALTKEFKNLIDASQPIDKIERR